MREGFIVFESTIYDYYDCIFVYNYPSLNHLDHYYKCFSEYEIHKNERYVIGVWKIKKLHKPLN